MPEFTIRPSTPDEVGHLFRASDQHFSRLYPAESNHLVGPQKFLDEGSILLGAEIAGRLVGCVGVIPLATPSEAEIKRLFVEEDQRGKGIAKRLVVTLEDRARMEGIHSLFLESGSAEHAAIALYRKLEYVECGPFSDYTEDPNSVFMTKSFLTSDQ